MSSWIPSAIGALSSLFIKPKTPRDRYADMVNKLVNRAMNRIDQTDLESLDNRAIDFAKKQALEISDRVLKNNETRQYSAGRNPDMYDSEDGVARGIIAKAVADQLAQMSFQAEQSRPSRELEMLNVPLQAIGMGSGMERQFMADQQQRRNALSGGIYEMASLIPWDKMFSKGSQSSGGGYWDGGASANAGMMGWLAQEAVRRSLFKSDQGKLL